MSLHTVIVEIGPSPYAEFGVSERRLDGYRIEQCVRGHELKVQAIWKLVRTPEPRDRQSMMDRCF